MFPGAAVYSGRQRTKSRKGNYRASEQFLPGVIPAGVTPAGRAARKDLSEERRRGQSPEEQGGLWREGAGHPGTEGARSEVEQWEAGAWLGRRSGSAFLEPEMGEVAHCGCRLSRGREDLEGPPGPGKTPRLNGLFITIISQSRPLFLDYVKKRGEGIFLNSI